MRLRHHDLHGDFRAEFVALALVVGISHQQTAGSDTGAVARVGMRLLTLA
jgi:hypothetical protein